MSSKPDYFSTNGCAESFHIFARDNSEDRTVQAYHVLDNALCKAAEFRFTEMLGDDLRTMVQCPWCLCNTLNDDGHIRRCSGYSKPASVAEVMDAYSDPTDHSKREAMLLDIQEKQT